MKRPLWLSQVLCEDDANLVVCPVRLVGLAGFVGLCLGQGYATITTGHFDALPFASGVAAIASAVGVGTGIKARMGA